MEGFSNPLWTLLIALCGLLRLPLVEATQLLGRVLGSFAPLAVAAWGPMSRRRPMRLEDGLAPVLCATSPVNASWIGSGMATGLHAFLLATGGLFLLKAAAEGKGVMWGLALGFGAMGVFFVILARGDWMFHWRFLAPLIPMAGALAAAGGSAIREAMKRPFTLAAASVLTVVLAAHCQAQTSLSLKVKEEVVLPYTFIENWVHRNRALLAPFGMKRPLIAFADIGGLGIGWREAEVVDVAGLASIPIAMHSKQAAAREDFLVSEGLPTLIVTHGPAGWLMQLPDLLSHYEPSLGTARILRGLNALEDPRCPGSKSAVLEYTVEALSFNMERLVAEARPIEALKLWRCALMYRDEQALPKASWRSHVSALAASQMHLLLSINLEKAVRFGSLATVLADEELRLRRKTEQLRRLWLSQSQKLPKAGEARSP